MTGGPSEKAQAMDVNPHASPGGTYVAGLWCHRCEEFMVTTPMELCPPCSDDVRRAS